MTKKHGIYWVLAAIAFFMLPIIVVATDKTVYLPIIGEAGGDVPKRYNIGDTGPAGGFVFYVDSDRQHGLEAAPSDQSIGIRWYNGSYTNTEAHGDGVGAGEMNTMLIIANQGSDSDSYAAGLCANLVITNAGIAYGDWYLPSKEELNLMYNNLHVAGKGDFASYFYWSSSEYTDNGAWDQYFLSGIQDVVNKEVANRIRVRAIRAF